MKEQFINTYIASFLAGYNVKLYDEACSLGSYKRLENPPIEDARYLAEVAWKKLQEQL